LTAASSVTSNISGTKSSPNSAVSRSASDVLRMLPKTRKPLAMRTFAVPHPMPVEVPVITTVRKSDLPGGIGGLTVRISAFNGAAIISA